LETKTAVSEERTLTRVCPRHAFQDAVVLLHAPVDNPMPFRFCRITDKDRRIVRPRHCLAYALTGV
jgi:hypothetical protein